MYKRQGAALLIALAWPWTFGKVQAAPFLGDMKFHTYVQIPNHAFLFLLGGICLLYTSRCV